MLDWMIMMFERTDLGGFWVIINALVHFQIYVMLFVMQWCAWHVKVISRKIQALKEQSGGTYQGVELNISNATSREAREESSLLSEDRPTREAVTSQIADQLISNF